MHFAVIWPPRVKRRFLIASIQKPRENEGKLSAVDGDKGGEGLECVFGACLRVLQGSRRKWFHFAVLRPSRVKRRFTVANVPKPLQNSIKVKSDVHKIRTRSKIRSRNPSEKQIFITKPEREAKSGRGKARMCVWRVLGSPYRAAPEVITFCGAARSSG